MHLRIEYLTGVARSSRFDDASSAEWPPHPARVFSALVDALYADEPVATSERAALEWLEAQPPPDLTVSEACEREGRTVFVPVNDKGMMESKVNEYVGKLDEAERALSEAPDARAAARLQKEIDATRKKLAKVTQKVAAGDGTLSDPLAVEATRGLAGQERTRQPRMFPATIPHDPVVWLHWQAEPSEAHHRALDALARRVVRIGHSSSLVACRLTETAPEPNLWVAELGEHALRTTRAGQLAALDREFSRSRATLPRILPATSTAYSEDPRHEGLEATPASTFGEDWIVLRQVGGARLPLTRSVDLAHAVRRCLLAANGPLSSVVTGHRQDGGPAETPHLAFVPLPFVDHEHATGQLLGIALVPPRGLDAAHRQDLLRAVATWVLPHEDDPDEGNRTLPVRIGRLGLRLERALPGRPLPSTLTVRTWSRPARVWRSVTPVALGRNPGNLFSERPEVRERAFGEAESTVRESVVRLGLPEPEHVEIHTHNPVAGSLHVDGFPPYPPQKGRTRRVKVHVTLTFAERVRGPLLLGAGRYLGTGLFRPMEA